MFEKSTIEAYRQVKAPSELKARVVYNQSMKTTDGIKNRLYKTVSVMAACFVLIFSVAAFENQNDVSVLCYGEKLTKEPMIVADSGIAVQALETASMARSVSASVCIPLEIETNQKMHLSVSAGEMQIMAKDTNESLFLGAEYHGEDAVLVEWFLEEGQEAELVIRVGKRESHIFLRYEETEGIWVIYQE